MPKFNKIKKIRLQNARRLNETVRLRRASIQNEPCDVLLSQNCSPQYNHKENVAAYLNSSISEGNFNATRKTPENELEELPLSIEICKSNDEPVNINGRRIVNIKHFYTELQKLSNHGPFQCGLSSVQLISERQNGISSTFMFKCQMCNETFYIRADDDSALDINTSAVAGSVAVGCGRSQLNELFASMDLPLFTYTAYENKLKLINRKWEEELTNCITTAAEEERCAAIAEGRIDKDGIPLIDVIADGCWGKRSYQKNYSSLSGAAAIIGRRTGKILYMAVKNKYCCICAQAANKHLVPKEHNCYKNYTGSSTGMESTIIVEGFKTSIEMHNLIYARLISDGDASTYAKLLQSRPYPSLTIEKIECRNHLFRNLCNKLQLLKKDTKYLLKYRKLLTRRRILCVRRAIVKGIAQYQDSENVEALHADIMLAADHAFGIHSRCKQYFCSNVGENEGIEKELFTNSFWQRINNILTHIAAHARSLIQNVDSNIVERYHSIVAKFVGGKRINFSLKFQYQMRCTGAALSFNSQKPLSLLHKSILRKSPTGQVKTFEDMKIKKIESARKNPKKKRRLFQEYVTSENYGENCLKPDMTEEVLEKSKEIFLKNLEKSPEAREQITRDTILQSGSSEWLELRRNMLTASNFGRVIKRRYDVSCANIVKDLLYKQPISHVQSIKHGLNNELVAKKQLQEQEKIIIKDCGLYIDQEFPFLGASPDGIADDETIVEIKCPITCFKTGLLYAINNKKFSFYKKTSDGSLITNKEHNWWYQIQGQLHIAKKQKCILGIWSGQNEPVKVETILRDDEFWETKMKNKLTSFYLTCILPELVDPRNTRSMPIRDPDYILKAIEEKTIKKEEKENRMRKRTIKLACIDSSKPENFKNKRNNKMLQEVEKHLLTKRNISENVYIPEEKGGNMAESTLNGIFFVRMPLEEERTNGVDDQRILNFNEF